MIDPLVMQKLVDGHLDETSVRELIQRAESEPQLWRQIGSAFVEDRIFNSAICGLFADESLPQPQAKSVRPAADVRPIADVRGSDTNRSGETNRSGAAGRMLSLAASVLIALGIGGACGWYLNGIPANSIDSIADGVSIPGGTTSADESTPTNGPVDPAGDDPVDRPHTTLVQYEPTYMDLQDADGSRLFDSEVPLYTMEEAKQMGFDLSQPRVSDDARTIVTDAGFGFDENIQYVSGTLQDGRGFVIPVRTIQLQRGQ